MNAVGDTCLLRQAADLARQRSAAVFQRMGIKDRVVMRGRSLGETLDAEGSEIHLTNEGAVAAEARVVLQLQ